MLDSQLTMLEIKSYLIHSAILLVISTCKLTVKTFYQTDQFDLIVSLNKIEKSLRFCYRKWYFLKTI